MLIYKRLQRAAQLRTVIWEGLRSTRSRFQGQYVTVVADIRERGAARVLTEHARSRAGIGPRCS